MSRALKTVAGLVLTAVMLFPVYWMINVSFTRDTDMRADPPHLFPFDGTLEGYRAVLDQQLPYLGTSLLIGAGTVAVTLALSAPAGYSLAKLRPRGGADSASVTATVPAPISRLVPRYGSCWSRTAR